MPDADKNSKTPIGDPPTRKQAVRADAREPQKQPTVPMMDPFTEQTTHPAGDGQGASGTSTGQAGGKQPSSESGDDEETMPIEEGFSPIP